MAHEDPHHDHPRSHTGASRTQLFTVRLWLEDVDGGIEYRGQVRNVVSGAFRGFRAWSELTDFLTALVHEDGAMPSERDVRESR